MKGETLTAIPLVATWDIGGGAETLASSGYHMKIPNFAAAWHRQL